MCSPLPQCLFSVSKVGDGIKDRLSNFKIAPYKKGYVLPIAVLCGMIIMSLSAILLTSLNNELVLNKASEGKIQSKYLAEAGIEHGFYLYNEKIKNNENDIGSFNFEGSIKELGKYTVQYKMSEQSNNTGTFYSTGVTIDKSETKIMVEFNINTGETITWKVLN